MFAIRYTKFSLQGRRVVLSNLPRIFTTRIAYVMTQNSRMARREPGRCIHNLRVCSKCLTITDAARRMADRINSVVTFHQPWAIRSQWMAIRLEDGGTDGVLYDTKQDAIRRQLHEQLCLYFPMGRAGGGVTPRDCQVLLNLHRHLYDAGGRIADADAPGGGPDLIVSTRSYEHLLGQNPRNVRLPRQ